MLRPNELKKVQVIGLRKDVDRIVATLQRLGVIEIVKNSDGRLEQRKAPQELGVVSEYLVRYRNMMDYLGVENPGFGAEKKSTRELLRVCAKDERLVAEVESLQRNASDARRKKDELESANDFIKQVGRLSFDPSLLTIGSLAYFFGTMPTQNIKAFREAGNRVTESFEIRSTPSSKFESICLVAVDKKHSTDFESLLAKNGFSKIAPPNATGNITLTQESVAREIASIDNELDRIEERRQAISDEFGATIAATTRCLENEKARLDVQNRFGSTKNALVIEGWIPAERLDMMRGELADALEGRMVVREVETDDEPPTLAKTPTPMKPFEDMVEFMSVPNPHEINPTIIFAAAFLTFYGMILGDVVYGIMSLIAGLYVAKKSKGLLRSIGLVWVYAAVPTIFFGFLYDEFLGFPQNTIFGFELYTAPLGRIQNLQLLLVISLVLGILHITLGLVLGFVNYFYRGEARHMLSKVAWAGIEFTLIAGVAAYILKVVDLSPYLVLGIGAVSVAVLYWTEGLVGVMEIPSMASNIMSYTRLVALGISSIAIAGVINTVLSPSPYEGWLFFAKLPLFVLGHLINLALGMFESLIQSARLNYVEFFSKFFKGGGRRFNPFRLDRKHLLEGGM